MSQATNHAENRSFEVDNALPQLLMSPRRIERWSQVPAFFGNRFYLRGRPNEELQRIASAAGVLGPYVQRGEKIFKELQDWLPQVCAQTILPFWFDLIPNTAWGASLSALLVQSQWDKIRKGLFTDSGGVCEFCGDPKTGRLAAQEVWEYHEPPELFGDDDPREMVLDVPGIARLVAILSVCPPCHSMFSIRLNGTDDKAAKIKSRIMGLNRWNEEELDIFIAEANERHLRRTRCAIWLIDITALRSEDFFTIKGDWSREPADPRLISTIKPFHGGETSVLTGLIGSKWRIATDPPDRSAAETITLQEAYT